MITIDFTKAQALTKDRLRSERKPLLELLDVKTMQNITNTTVLSEIEIKKQALRDVTLLVDTALTLDELKALKVEYPKPEVVVETVVATEAIP